MRRLWLCLFFAALISCGGAQKKPGSSGGGLSEEQRAFIDNFWTNKHVAHYIAKVDALIDTSVKNASVDESVSGRHVADTSNRVKVIISLTHQSDASVYHVSFSHHPYLATTLAKQFAGLVALRLGFAIPPKISVSQNQVFHLGWTVPNTQEARDMLASARKQLRAQTSTENIANYVFLKSLEMKIVEVDVPAK